MIRTSFHWNIPFKKLFFMYLNFEKYILEYKSCCYILCKSEYTQGTLTCPFHYCNHLNSYLLFQHSLNWFLCFLFSICPKSFSHHSPEICFWNKNNSILFLFSKLQWNVIFLWIQTEFFKIILQDLYKLFLLTAFLTAFPTVLTWATITIYHRWGGF